MKKTWLRATVIVVFQFAAVGFSSAQQPSTTFRTETQIVLVPTLVTNGSGAVIHGLKADDFVIEDNGVPQMAYLDESPDEQPISLVVALQRGRSARDFFMGHERGRNHVDCRLDTPPCHTEMDTLRLMLESFIGERKTRVAVVTFDSEVQLFQDFTESIQEFERRLFLLTPGDNGTAILDAVQFSLGLLDREPKSNRRVIWLISERRDHGSSYTLTDAVRRITASNTLLYSISFSPGRTEFLRDLMGRNPNPGNTDLLGPIISSAQAMRKNIAREAAEMTGGEYQTFADKESLENSLAKLSNHVRNRYLLSFRPSNPTPGPHTITVRLRNPRKDTAVLARKSYWASDGSLRVEPGL